MLFECLKVLSEVYIKGPKIKGKKESFVEKRKMSFPILGPHQMIPLS